MKIKLGARVKDPINGYEGIVIARTDWLYGCVRIGVVASHLDKDGKPLGEEWFDEDRLEVLRKRVIKPKEVTTGGPNRNDGSRQKDPSR